MSPESLRALLPSAGRRAVATWLGPRLPPLALVAVGATLAYAVLFDQGALLALLTGDQLAGPSYLHELFHDARHLLGVVCH
ncbi:MAG: CbtB-domain containing protein [Actinomycetota bacterium]|nr:CbtB-domain containing protein [Actinomycetota bacterium]